MRGMYAPRARVQTFDMDNETGDTDAALDARAAAESRAAARARAAGRTIVSSASNLDGTAPAIAATWSADARRAASAATTAIGTGTIRIPGLAIAPVTPDLAEYLGKGSRDGYLVLESSGQWSALHAGDVLLSVNGDCVRQTGISTASDAREAVVLRKGRKLTLNLAAY